MIDVISLQSNRFDQLKMMIYDNSSTSSNAIERMIKSNEN